MARPDLSRAAAPVQMARGREPMRSRLAGVVTIRNAQQEGENHEAELT